MATFFSQFTTEQLRASYARGADGLRQLLAKAERTGRKANGFTAEYLRERVALFSHLATASDDDIRAHVARSVVPSYETRKALRDATLAIGRPKAAR